MELFKIPIFGRAMRNVGYISIDRSNRQSAFESLKLAADKIKSGVSVLIFPEGTRSLDGKIRPFKKGGFVMAIDSGVPIVPVVITGTRAMSAWLSTSRSKLRLTPMRQKKRLWKTFGRSSAAILKTAKWINTHAKDYTLRRPW